MILLRACVQAARPRYFYSLLACHLYYSTHLAHEPFDLQPLEEGLHGHATLLEDLVRVRVRVRVRVSVSVRVRVMVRVRVRLVHAPHRIGVRWRRLVLG